MSSFIARRIQSFLDQEKLAYELDVQLLNSPGFWKGVYGKEAEDIYKKLGAQFPEGIREVPLLALPIVFRGKVIIGDDELVYNRYASLCAKSPFYAHLEDFKVDAFLRYCRQFEVNCKKGGLQSGIWTNALSERHFGTAAEPGDFFGNGSPGWKMRSLQYMLRDMRAKHEGFEVWHISIYDQVMSGGRLLTLRELLQSPAAESYLTFEKYLRRKLGLPVPTA